jgi:hypothetical protein
MYQLSIAMKPEESVRNTTGQTDQDKLLSAQEEIHELALQFALGKAEAKEKFEEVKNEFRKQITEVKNSLKNLTNNSVSAEIWVKLEALEWQLSLGEAKSKSLFEEQLIKIKNAIAAVEKEVTHYLENIHVWKIFGHEAEKFKLKLEILRLRFTLKKFELKDDYDTLMKNARANIKKIAADPTKNMVTTAHEQLADFRKDIIVAYKHIMKALETLK